jgi:N-acetylglucosamine malate deacetylase 1
LEILVIAAHPDDEVLGMGGTIKKLSKNNKIHLCIVTDGASAQYTDKKMIKVRQNACKDSGKILGISTYDFLDFPDMKLDTIPHVEINNELNKILKKYKPQIVFSTPNDLNKDHQLVLESTLVVTRPICSSVKQILSYEIPGFVKTQFQPNYYENITKELSFKKKAFGKYKTELEKFPHPRSLEFIESLSMIRGTESGCKRAEAFNLIKKIND